MNKYILIIFLINANLVLSQSNEGEIEDAQILIEKNSNIILPKVDKEIKKIELENKNIDKKTFVFENIFFTPVLSKNKIDKILIDNSYSEVQKDIFIDLMGGNYSTFILNTNPYYKSGNTFAIYSDLYVKLNSKGYKLSNVSGEEINDINIYADYKYSVNSKISSHFNFNSYSNGYYGFINTENISLTDNLIDKLRFSNNSFYYKIDWENIGKKYNSNVNYSGKIFSNNFFNESFHKISANAILSSSNSLINLYPKFETYEIRENIDDPLTDNKLTLSLFEIPLIYDFQSKNFSLRINASYQFLAKDFKSKSTKHFFSPKIKLKYFNKNLTFKLSASRGYNYSRYSDEINLMPFIYQKGITNQFDFNKELFRVKTNLDFNLFDNSILSLGFESLKLEGNLDYTLYLGESLPTDIKIPMYLYTLERDGDVQIVNYFSFSYKTNISDNIESSFSFFHTVFEEDQVFQPQFLIDILTSYSNNKYSLSLGANMELENYGLNFKNELFKMKPFIDIYFNSTYFLSKSIELNFNVNNILNRYNERFFMYPELGTNFIVGVKWIF
tara:strand:- start:3574 stop:5247 length:1674 start_codon:yes stop_codon:yes gene_type:complete